MPKERIHMSRDSRRALATLAFTMLLPLGALAQPIGPGPTLHSAGPIRRFVEELNRTGGIRKSSDDEIVAAARAAGVVGTETDHVRAGETILRLLLSKLREDGKLSDGEPDHSASADPAGDSGPLAFGAGGTAEVEPNDTIATAQVLTCGETICASFQVAGDYDYFAFTPAVETRAVFTTTGDPGGDTRILVGVDRGFSSWFAGNDDTPGGSDRYSTCTVPCLAAGTRYLCRVEEMTLQAGIHYSLTISCTPTSDVPEVEWNGDYFDATDVGTAPFTACGLGSFGGVTDLDYLRFSLPADSLCTIENGPSSTDLLLLLGLLPSGRRLNFATSGNPGGERFTVGLRAGTYYVLNSDRKFQDQGAKGPWECTVSTAPPGEDDELEPDDTPATAFPIECNRTVHALSMADLTSGDTDYYAFTIPPGPSQPVSIRTGPSSADTFLALVAGDGVTVLASNDDVDPAHGLVDSEVDATLAPGSYFARVGNFLGPFPGAFGYTISILCPTDFREQEPNGTAATASPGLACGTSIAGRVGPISFGVPDVDYYSLTVASESAVTATLAGGANSADVAFLQPDGSTVIVHGTNSAIATLDAGSYFVRVTGLDTAGFDYMLLAACGPTPTPGDAEPNGDVPLANATSGCGDARIGLLSPRDSDVDYWSFTLSQWSLVTIQVTVPDQRSSVDPFLRIVDPTGNPLRVNDDFQGTSEARIEMNLPPGTWYAAVSSATTNASPDPRPDKDLYEIHVASCAASICSSAQPLPIDDGHTVAGTIASDPSSSRPMGCLEFTTIAPSTKIDVTVTSSTIEPSVFLVDATNAYLDYDDDDGDGEAANLTDTVPAGTYFLRVQNFGASPGDYAATLRFVTPDGAAESEPNDSTATANPLANFSVATGRLSSSADVDVYSFAVTGGTHAVTLIGRTSRDHDNSPQQATDLTLSILDGGGALIVSQNSDDGPDADEMLVRELPAGSYFARVSTSAPVDPRAGAYDLELRVADVSLSLSPTHGPLLPCGGVMSFTASGTSLRSSLFSATYRLQISIDGGAPTTLVTKTRGLNPGVTASKTFTRTLSQWLHGACPPSGSHVRVIFTATQGSQVARTTYACTVP
jgi:hypothetical protein